MGKLITLLAICCLLTPILTSCYDAREVDDMAYVTSIGIDEGISNKFRVSFQISTMKGSSAGSSQTSGGGVEPNEEVFTVDAPSFFGAVNLINATVSRRLNFMHTKYIVFSEDSARKGYIGTIAAGMIRYREIRRTTKVIVTNGSAEEFLKETIPTIGSLISKYQETLVRESEDTGFLPLVKLNDIYNGIKSPYIQPIAILGAVNNFKNLKKEGEEWKGPPAPIPYKAGEIPRSGGGKIELMGSVIGDGDILIDELDGFETRMLLIVTGQIKRLIFTTNDPENPEYSVVLQVRQARKPQVKVSFDGDKPIVNLNIKLEADIIAVQSRVQYEEPEKKKELEKNVAGICKDQIDKLVKKCKGKVGDVFGFGLVAAKQFWTIQDWEAYNWNNHFKDAEVTTSVDLIIRRTSGMIKSSPIITKEGKK